jgi:hypothetical protein
VKDGVVVILWRVLSLEPGSLLRGGGVVAVVDVVHGVYQHKSVHSHRLFLFQFVTALFLRLQSRIRRIARE